MLLDSKAEQKNTGSALRESERRFRELIEMLPDSVFEIDLTGIVTFGNYAARKLFGFSKQDIEKGLSLIEVLTPESQKRARQNMGRLLNGKKLDSTEYTAVRKDGSTFPIMIHSTPIIKGNVPVGFRGTIIDITDRKKLESELRASEERFRSLIDNAPDAIWLQDTSGIFVDGNKRAEEITGYKRDELIGNNILEVNLVPEKYVPVVLEALMALKIGEKSAQTELELRQKDGSLVSVETSAIPVERDGKIEIIGIARDITERKKQEELLRRARKKFETYFDLVKVMLVAIDAKGNVTQINKKGCEVLGYKKEQILGKNWFSTFLPKRLEKETKDYFRKILAGQIEPVEYNENPVLTKSGEERLIAWYNIQLRDEQGNLKGTLSSGQDITESKKAREELLRSEKRFRELSELLPEVVFETDIDGIITYVNRSAFDLFGFSEQDVEKGLNLIGLLTPDSQEKARKNVERILSGENLGTIEYVCVKKDGSTFPCLGHCAAIIKENKPVGVRGIIIDITEQKKAESEIQVLAKFPSENPAPVLRIAEDGTILYANKAAKTLEDKLKQKKEQLIPDKLKKAIFSSFQSGLTKTVEVNYFDQTFSFVVAPIPEAKYMNIYGRNITERKKIENELKKSEQKFRTIFEGATDGIIAINPRTHKIVFANPRMSEITGYSSDELLKLSTMELLQEESVPFFAAQFQKHLGDEKTVTRDIPILRKDKKVVYCDGSSKIMKIGNEKYLIGFVRDVTEQKKAEKALRESEENYRSIINAMDDTAWVIGFDGKFIDVNDAAVKVLGYSREELLSMGPIDIDNKLHPKQIEKIIKEMKINESQVFETEHKTKDGKAFPVEINTTQVTYQGKPAILSIARDITERKRAQEAIQEANRLLEKSNRDLESYTYVVSHDLKAPLRTIRSFSSFILEDYGDKLDETGKDYLNRMINASSHLNTMIEDLLVLSRVGRKFTEVEKVDLNELLNEILADLEATIKERNAKVVVDKLPTLRVHRVWKRQLFMNLISNALKFNESQTPTVEVLYEERENDHLFKVRDNGIGIEKKYLKHTFRLFERVPTEKKYDGTGAGLAICKKIVEHLGGKIWIESTPGKGSTFFFTIPKSELKPTKET